MKKQEIVVFVKTVFDTRQVSGSGELDREKMALSINRSDLFAIEMALRLSSQTNASVVICSMGVMSSRPVLEKLYALGVNEIDLISDNVLKGADTFATAKILSTYLQVFRPQSCLWLFGAESSDSATAQVGPQVAVQMKCPLVCDVVSIETLNDGALSLNTSGDALDTNVVAKPPLVVIASTQGTPLRVATVKGVLLAREKKCNIIVADMLGFESVSVGVDLSKTSVVKVNQMRDAPRKPERINIFRCVPFLLSQVAWARHMQEESLATLGNNDFESNRYLIVSDFYSGDGVSECRKIAAYCYALGVRDLALYAIGSPSRSELTATGIPVLYRCSECSSHCYDAISCGRCLAAFLTARKPQVVLFRASSLMRRVAPVTAALLESGLAADCTSFALSPEVIFERPTFGERRLASIRCCNGPLHMATLRGGRFHGKEYACKNPSCHSFYENCHCESRLRTCVLKRHDSALWNRDVVFVAGAGLNRDAFDALKLIAKTLNADFGVTRPLVDKGWAERRYQVGQTGATISHPLYVSFGVSGELEHRIAIGSSTKVFAININPMCAMASFCDYFVQGDANETISMLMQTITKGEKNDKRGNC